ncbi:hypothetical protein JHK82_055375 [Glycine max]|nr:hypothetical protein JHK82_055375 [Glycine max]
MDDQSFYGRHQHKLFFTNVGRATLGNPPKERKKLIQNIYPVDCIGLFWSTIIVFQGLRGQVTLSWQYLPEAESTNLSELITVFGSKFECVWMENEDDNNGVQADWFFSWAFLLGPLLQDYRVWMSAEDLIKNNGGIDDGKDVPEEYYRSLYEWISRNQIKIKELDLEAQQK